MLHVQIGSQTYCEPLMRTLGPDPRGGDSVLKQGAQVANERQRKSSLFVVRKREWVGAGRRDRGLSGP